MSILEGLADEKTRTYLKQPSLEQLDYESVLYLENIVFKKNSTHVGQFWYHVKGLNTLTSQMSFSTIMIATILDKINGTSGPPLPPISMMPKWRVFAPSRLHHCFGGEGG